MARKIPENNVATPLFMTWAPNDVVGCEKALASLAKGYKTSQNYQRTTAAGTYRNIDGPNISVRDGFTREDYNYFRPGERLPGDVKGIQGACKMAYRNFGIVRNMIDMMTDFVIKGITPVHKSPRVQKFAEVWFKRADGIQTSGKIIRRLLREGAAPIRRRIQKIDKKVLEELGVESRKKKRSPLGNNEIPLNYKILNPENMEVLGGELAQFVNDDLVEYGVKIPDHLVKQIKNPKTHYEREILKSLKPDLYKAALSGEQIIPISPDRLVMLHYKKDDDELWSTPILNAVLSDLQMLEKLKMADRAALDGAISHVRLWKMGSLEHRIIPSQEGIQNLADILLRSTGGGCVDLVWGPDLELVETKGDMYKFLGNEKYVSTMTAIYQGLGVPPSLTGIVSDTGMTNNFVSLRVLVERLEYCRDLLSKFWIEELEILQEVFGFRDEFSISYTMPSLSDDSAEKKLLIDMIDRNIVSGVFVQERFGADPEIENARIRQEEKKRERGKLPPKAGQFHIDSQQKPNLERLFVGQGEVTPSEVGMELKPRKPGEIPSADKQAERKLKEVKAKPKPTVSGAPAAKKKVKSPKTNGRPQGAKDDGKRKKKRIVPRQNSKASLGNYIINAHANYQKIDDLLKDNFLKLKNKSNMRQLTDEQVLAYEDLKFGILCGIKEGEEVDLNYVVNSMKTNITTPLLIKQLSQTTIEKYINENKSKPTLEQVRQIRAMAYVMYTYAEDEDDEDEEEDDEYYEDDDDDEDLDDEDGVN